MKIHKIHRSTNWPKINQNFPHFIRISQLDSEENLFCIRYLRQHWGPLREGPRINTVWDECCVGNLDLVAQKRKRREAEQNGIMEFFSAASHLRSSGLVRFHFLVHQFLPSSHLKFSQEEVPSLLFPSSSFFFQFLSYSPFIEFFFFYFFC